MSPHTSSSGLSIEMEHLDAYKRLCPKTEQSEPISFGALWQFDTVIGFSNMSKQFFDSHKCYITFPSQQHYPVSPLA